MSARPTRWFQGARAYAESIHSVTLYPSSWQDNDVSDFDSMDEGQLHLGAACFEYDELTPKVGCRGPTREPGFDQYFSWRLEALDSKTDFLLLEPATRLLSRSNV